MRKVRETAGRGLPAFGRVRRVLAGAAALGAIPGMAWAASFKQVPGASEDGGGAGEDPDMILGLIHANTLFFIVLGVFCVFWFLFGGGRKAQIGRKGH